MAFEFKVKRGLIVDGPLTASYAYTTASWAQNSLLSTNSSVSTQSRFTTQSLFTTQSVYATQSLYATSSLTASYFTSSTGITNYIPKWNVGTLTTSSNIYDNGINVGVGTTNPSYKLQVSGSFAATTKSFIIRHPTKPGKQLVYGSLEGPEHGIYFRGRSESSIIELPDYWKTLGDEDTLTVNITPIGMTKSKKVRKYSVKKVINNKIYIHTDSKDKVYNFYYTIFVERKDVPKLIVEENE